MNNLSAIPNLSTSNLCKNGILWHNVINPESPILLNPNK